MRRLSIAVALWLVLALTPSAALVSAGPCNQVHPCPTPPVVSVGAAWMTGWETGDGDAETNGGGGLQGSGLSFETTIVRTGSRSLKIAAVSGVAGIHAAATQSVGTSGIFARVYLRVTTRPATTARVIAGATTATAANLRLNPDGTIAYYVATTLVGTSTTALTDTARWYRVEWRRDTTASVVVLRIEGNDEVTGTGGTLNANVGPNDTVADTYTAYMDDLTTDTANFPGPGHVVLLLPVSDNSVGSGWTNDAASATNIFNAVKNTPPQGIADTTGGNGLHQIRNASTLNSYVANLATYASAGIPADAVINAVQPLTITGAPVTTGAKTGSIAMSNPTIAALALTGNSGQFWTGAAAGTYVTGWKLSRGTISVAPTVTVGSNPTVTIAITGGTAARVAMDCFIGAYVDYQPRPINTILQTQQAVNRAASF